MRATTQATISPAKLTRLDAIAGWAGAFWSSVIGQAHGQPRALLLGDVGTGEHGDAHRAPALAAEVSIDVMVAWANGLRTIAMCSMPGSLMLSVHRVRPVISRASSLRRRGAADLAGGGALR